MKMKRQDKMQLPKPVRSKNTSYINRVAMVTDEGAFNQHEPNAGMARLFVVMVMIHVVVIGGIIVYDYLNSPVAAPRPARTQPAKAGASALPPSAVSATTLEKELPIEDYATYEWRSGDSIPKVAEKLKVPQDVLIRLNMLDKGAQLDQNTILRYPRQPVVRAVSIPDAALTTEAAPPAESLASATQAVDLPPAPAPEFSFAPTIVGELARAPDLTPGRAVQSAPPAPAPATAAPRVQEQPPAAVPVVADSVPKAIPVPAPQVAALRQSSSAVAKPATVAAKAAPKATAKASTVTHTVKLGDNLHRIASRHQVSVKALQEANKLSDPNHIREGMKLIIPTR
jgi:LysM repeat protein